MSLKITNLILQPHLPGANELRSHIFRQAMYCLLRLFWRKLTCVLTESHCNHVYHKWVLRLETFNGSNFSISYIRVCTLKIGCLLWGFWRKKMTVFNNGIALCKWNLKKISSNVMYIIDCWHDNFSYSWWAKFMLGKIKKNPFILSIISQHWDGVDPRNPRPWKTRSLLSYRVNIIWLLMSWRQ